MYDYKDGVKRRTSCGLRWFYMIRCDECNKNVRYSIPDKQIKKNYCKSCQYKKLSRVFSKLKVWIKCCICDKDMQRTRWHAAKSKNPVCSKECRSKECSKRQTKNIKDIIRSNLRKKMLSLGVEPRCVICGHDHLWNLQAHHKIFVVNGGSSELDNLEFQCRNCHADTHIKHGKDKDLYHVKFISSGIDDNRN